MEFALVAPVLMLILGAVVDFGFGFYTAMDVVKSAQSAASTGAGKKLDDAAVKSLTSSVLLSHKLSPGLATVSVTHPVIEGLPTVRVNISYAWTPITPLIQAILGSQYRLVYGAVYAKSS